MLDTVNHIHEVCPETVNNLFLAFGKLLRLKDDTIALFCDGYSRVKEFSGYFLPFRPHNDSIIYCDLNPLGDFYFFSESSCFNHVSKRMRVVVLQFLFPWLPFASLSLVGWKES